MTEFPENASLLRKTSWTSSFVQSTYLLLHLAHQEQISVLAFSNSLSTWQWIPALIPCLQKVRGSVPRSSGLRFCSSRRLFVLLPSSPRSSWRCIISGMDGLLVRRMFTIRFYLGRQLLEMRRPKGTGSGLRMMFMMTRGSAFEGVHGA